MAGNSTVSICDFHSPNLVSDPGPADIHGAPINMGIIMACCPTAGGSSPGVLGGLSCSTQQSCRQTCVSGWHFGSRCPESPTGTRSSSRHRHVASRQLVLTPELPNCSLPLRTLNRRQKVHAPPCSNQAKSPLGVCVPLKLNQHQVCMGEGGERSNRRTLGALIPFVC